MAISKKKALVPVLGVVAFAIVYIFGGSHFLTSCGNSGSYAMERLKSCPKAVALLGDDISYSSGISCGSYGSTGGHELASVSVPVSGSKGSGTYSYTAEILGKQVRFSGSLSAAGQTIDIGTCSTGGSDRRRWNDFPCHCIAEGEKADRRVQLALSVDDNPTQGPFVTAYRLHVGKDGEYPLAVTEQTAPSNQTPSRLLEFGIACAQDRVIVATQRNVSAWSLDDGKLIWERTLDRSLNLLSGRTPKKNFTLKCRVLTVKDNRIQVPLGKTKAIPVLVTTGEVARD